MVMTKAPDLVGIDIGGTGAKAGLFSLDGTPLHPSNLRIDFNHTLKAAGIERNRFNDLRHTAA